MLGEGTLNSGAYSQTFNLSGGTHTIVAIYRGDANFNPSQATFVETITKAGMHKLGGIVSFGLCTSTMPRHAPFWMRANRPLQRRLSGWDFSYPLMVIRGGAEFERVVQLCVGDPLERAKVV